MAFSYNAPAPSEASTRNPQSCPFHLKDKANREQYRSWRLNVAAYLTSQSELKYLESAVRTALIASLGEQLKTQITGFFSDRLGSATVKEVIAYLDQEH